mgnify:CR=1 FL=1
MVRDKIMIRKLILLLIVFFTMSILYSQNMTILTLQKRMSYLEQKDFETNIALMWSQTSLNKVYEMQTQTLYAGITTWLKLDVLKALQEEHRKALLGICEILEKHLQEHQ